MSAEHLEAATALIRQQIENAQGPLPPAFLVEFLLKEWRRYLAAVHHDFGAESLEWNKAVAATERLLWSVAPKSDTEERSRLLAAIEPVVAAVKLGMDVAGTEAASRQSFLRTLADIHLARINPSKDSSAADKGKESLGDDTVSIDMRDPRYAKLLDMLNEADIEYYDMDR